MELVIVSIWLALGVLGMFSYICKKEDALEKQSKIDKDVRELKESFEKHKKVTKPIMFILFVIVALVSAGVEYLGLSNAHSLLMANHAGLAARVIFDVCLLIVISALGRFLCKLGRLFRFIVKEDFEAVAEMAKANKKTPVFNSCRIVVGVTVLLVLFA